MRKMFEAIGKVTTRLMAVVIGIYIARFLPLWLGGIIAVCAFIALVISEMRNSMTRRDEIAKAAFDYINSESVKATNMQLAFGDFINGAEWMLEKTITWFYKNAHKRKYWDKDGCLLITIIMDDYRSAMEK